MGYRAGEFGATIYNLFNSAAFGAHAIPVSSNDMILGNDSVQVGIGLSNDVTLGGPQNKLEVDAGILGHSPTAIGAVGASGIRMRDLHSGTATIPNPGLGVLAVNPSGDVIYVPYTTGIIANAQNGLSLTGGGLTVELGSPVSGGAPLLHNSFIDHNGFNLIFKNLPKVGIGNNYSTSFGTAPLTIDEDNMADGFRVYHERASSPGTAVRIEEWSNNAINNTGLYVDTRNSTGNNYSVLAYAMQSGAAYNYAGNFNASAGVNNYAIDADASCTALTTTNVGIRGSAHVSSFNPTVMNAGVIGITDGTASNFYGVYGIALNPSSSAWAGFFNGNVFATGSVDNTSGVFGPSDSTLKENINSLTHAKEILNLINPKTFNYKTSAYPQFNFPSTMQYGIIAQEVESNFPGLIKIVSVPAQYDTLGNIISPAVNYKALNYQQFIPILIAGVKEQQNKIDSLETTNNNLNDRLTALETCINNLNLCTESRNIISNEIIVNQTNVELTNAQSIVLNQNVPNPFAEQTIIIYTLLDGTKKAEMHFYNSEGKMINSVELSTAAGKSQLNVFANDLTNGVYTYTLVVDGKIIDTKRMVKNK